MRKSFVSLSFVLALGASAALVFGGVAAFPRTAAAADAKNLKVLPPDMSKADIKKLMKSIAAALGVECEFCHDTDDFAKDTEKKEIAHQMIKMVGAINKDFFKGERKVGCITCHNGQKEPKKLQ